MKSNLMVKLGLAIAVISCILFSCSKMDNSYKDFIREGEIIYREKPDSIIVFSGHNRVKLTWFLISNPNISECRVYWNNGKDSVEVPVSLSAGEHSVSTIIDGLAEGSYTFEIYTYDMEGNASIGADTIGWVYGDSYVRSLINRGLKSATFAGSSARLDWAKGIGKGAIGTEILYHDMDGAMHELSTSLSDDITRIEEQLQGDSLQYRTLFMPDSSSIDTFYTPYKTVILEEATPQKLDQSKFTELALPNDAQRYNTLPLSNLWNEVLSGGSQSATAWYRTANGSGIPGSFTFDMGATAKLSRFIMWQRGTTDEQSLLYANSNPLKWEIWGCSEEPPSDGSWTGWTKLMDCESIKPSGLPVGQKTDEDIQHAAAGEEFTFPADAPPVRYLRIKILQTWGNLDHVFLSEVALYGIAQ